jgi:hypothetical protein
MGGIEDRLVVIAVELPATEASAGRETKGSIDKLPTQVMNTRARILWVLQ